jgi:hypothetical protein
MAYRIRETIRCVEVTADYTSVTESRRYTGFSKVLMLLGLLEVICGSLILRM